MDESQSEQGYTVVNMSVRMVVVAVNLVGNSLILAVVRKSQNFSFVTRHLIGHVAVADIMFGCSMVIHGFLILAGSMSYPACLGITTIAVISGLCSCWGIFLVFLDNYLSVQRLGPAAADKGLTLQKARWCIVSGWMLSVLHSLVFLLDAPKDLTTTNCSLGGPAYTYSSLLSLGIVLLAISFATVFLMSVTLYTIKKRMDSLFQEGTHIQNVLRQRNLKMRSRIIRLFVIIAVGFIISWCPGGIAMCVAMLCSDRCGITYDNFKLLSSFMTLNAMMNVIVYAIKDKKFRMDATKSIMCQGNAQHNAVAPQHNTVALQQNPVAPQHNAVAIVTARATAAATPGAANFVGASTSNTAVVSPATPNSGTTMTTSIPGTLAKAAHFSTTPRLLTTKT